MSIIFVLTLFIFDISYQIYLYNIE